MKQSGNPTDQIDDATSLDRSPASAREHAHAQFGAKDLVLSEWGFESPPSHKSTRSGPQNTVKLSIGGLLVECQIGLVPTTDRWHRRYFVPHRQSIRQPDRTWRTRTTVISVSVETMAGPTDDRLELLDALEQGRVELVADTTKVSQFVAHRGAVALLLYHGVVVGEGGDEPSVYHCRLHVIGGAK